MPTQSKVLNGLLDSFEPTVSNAFRAAMADWRNKVDLAALVRALQNGDMAAAVQAMHLDPAALNPFLDTLANAYKSSGIAMSSGYPTFITPTSGSRFTIAFNTRDPIAEAWLRQQSGRLITDITSRQQTAVQQALEAGLAQGDNPTTTALDIVGRVGTNGKRTGGIVGLSIPQAQYLKAAKLELASNDPALLGNYLTRALRDRRFDGFVDRALDGTPIPSDTRTKMLVAYSNRLLKLRGDTIARTETLPALHEGQTESVRQAIAKGAFKASQTRKTWEDAGDSRVRHSHEELDGTTVAFNRPFVSTLGNRMMYPGDVSLGAGAEDIVNCRCIAPIRVDFLAGVK